jgi:hypothetical protein
MLSVHPYEPDGTAYCGRGGCGLPRKNWRHDTANTEPVEDWTEPRHQPDPLPIPIQRGRTARQRKAPRARSRRTARR